MSDLDCHPLLLPGENFSLCCMNGNSQLTVELLLLENLLNLYQVENENSRDFRKNRSYKNQYAFASIQYNLQPPSRGGVCPFYPGPNEKTGVMDSFTFTILMLLAINALETRKVLVVNQWQFQGGWREGHASLISSEKNFFTDNFALFLDHLFRNSFPRNIICEGII